MKNIIIYLLLAMLMFASCTQRGCQEVERELQFSERSYTVTVLSGGDTVFQDSFYGIINQEKSSDGIFYTKNGILYEISGDYVITSTQAKGTD